MVRGFLQKCGSTRMARDSLVFSGPSSVASGIAAELDLRFESDMAGEFRTIAEVTYYYPVFHKYEQIRDDGSPFL